MNENTNENVYSNSRYKIFKNLNLGEVRTVKKEGDRYIWFYMNDICKILDIADPGNVTARLVDFGLEMELDTIEGNRTHTNQYGATYDVSQKETIVSEMALTIIITTSRKPQAQEFMRWISAEVVPSLAKHGGYIMEEDREEYKEDPEKVKELVEKLEAKQSATAKSQRAFDETREDKFRINNNSRNFIVPYGRLNDLMEQIHYKRDLTKFYIHGTLEEIRREMNEVFDSLYRNDRL